MTNKTKTFFKLIKTIRNFPTYLFDYFGLLKRKYILYKLRNGLKYKVRAGSTDRFILNEIWIHKSYTPKGFEIKKDDIVVDIGAHMEIFTIMASYFAKNGYVYAFEPSKENFLLLKQNILLNSANNIEAINKAVSDKSGKLKFYISQSKNKGQNSLFKLDGNQKEEIVEKISFKSFIKKVPRIDFLKMDCEARNMKYCFH